MSNKGYLKKTYFLKAPNKWYTPSFTILGICDSTKIKKSLKKSKRINNKKQKKQQQKNPKEIQKNYRPCKSCLIISGK